MGGKSSSSNTTVNNIEVKPVTNVKIDTEEIAAAIENLATGQEAEAALIKAGLALEATKMQQQEQQETLQFIQDEKTRHQITLAVVIAAGYFAWKHLK